MEFKVGEFILFHAQEADKNVIGKITDVKVSILFVSTSFSG
jgi:hypothetical protein